MSMELPLRKARATASARTSPAASSLAVFVWPFFAILLLAALCSHRLWPHSQTHLISDWASHTLYQGFIALAAVLILFRAWRGSHKFLFWWPVLVSIGTFSSVEILKRLTQWPRPNGEPTGFPSGHTMFSFGLAWLLTQTYPRLAPLWFGLAVTVGWSRLDGNAHYPYQILCGAVFGTALGWLISHRLGQKTAS